MRPGLLLPDFDGFDPVEQAVQAEADGYASVWLNELWGRAAPVTAAAIAERTDRVGIGFSVVNVFSRTPAVLAMTAASLADRSDGRFVMGVGTSTRKVVEDLHGLGFDRPVRRAHETVDLLRRFTVGSGPVEYDGELFAVADFPGLDRAVPIYGAALGPANRRMVGRLCDGWIPHNLPFPELDGAFDTIAEAAGEAGRDPDEITVAPYVPIAVSDDPAEARAAIRGHVAYYVGSGAGYRRAVATRFPEAAERIAEAWGAGDREAARAAVSDTMIDALGIAGPAPDARAALRDLVERTVVDRPVLVLPAGAASLAEATIAAMAPDR